MGAIAVFSYPAWEGLYPQFSNVTEAQADLAFSLATLFLRNDGTGVVCDPTAQLNLLNMLTAHIAYLTFGDNKSGGATGLVGRISGATEGSVSVQTENQYAPGTVQWFQQTPFGSMFWAATAAFRTFRYRVGPGIYNGLGVGQNAIRQAWGNAGLPWVYATSTP